MALPSGPLDGLLCAFSSANSAAKFALATPDGRIKTYDTVSGRLSSTLSVGASKAAAAAANGHLAEGQQCLTWVDSEESSSAEARSSNPAGPSHSWLAVGTSAGAVKCYDSATGELRWAAANMNEGGVSCLAYSAAGRGGLLLSSGPDGQAVSLDTHSGKKLQQFRASKHGASAAALSQDGSKLLLGGSTLTVWDLEAQQRIARLTGHPLPVRALCFSHDAAYAISAAVGERLVAVWVVPGSSSGKKKSAGGVAAASLAVAQPVVQLATAAAGDAEPAGSFYAAATTEAAEVYVWLIRPKGETGVDAQQVARLAVDPQHKQQEAIFAAALEHTAVGATLVVAVGSAAKPRFERVPMGTKAIKSSKITFLQPPPNSTGLIQTPAAVAEAKQAGAVVVGSKAAAAAEVLGADNAGQLVQQRQSKASKKRSEPEPDGGQLQGGAGAGDDEDEDGLAANGLEGMDTEEEQELSGEPTLGQRVFELEKQQRDQDGQEVVVQAAAAAAGDAGAEDAAAAGAAAAAAAVLPAGQLKADSLAVLLSQALRSSDRALLERCLSVGRERVITNSVRRLVPMDAALLLKAAVERLQSKPSRGQQLAAWIHAVLLHHTAYLMSAPAAAPLMSSLYQIIEARLAMQRQLLSLAGRLELLLAQRGPEAGAGGADGGGAGGVAAAAPQVVYQESDSEAEVEIVDAAAGGASSDDDLEEDGDDEFTTDEGDDDMSDDAGGSSGSEGADEMDEDDSEPEDD